MATKLYRAGKSHCVNGIECEVRLFPHNGLSFIGLHGWCSSPEDINKVDKTDEWADYTPDQIRELAKDQDIEGWDSKRITTLKEVLSGSSKED